MHTPKVQSRVQLRNRVKQRGTNKKHHVEKPKAKQTNNDARSCTKAPKVYTFSVESSDPVYDDDSNHVDHNVTSFSRKRVLTTDEQKSDGAFKSGLRTVLIFCRTPLVTDSPNTAGNAANERDHESSGACASDNQDESNDHDVKSVPYRPGAPDSIPDDADDPPNSLLMLAPLYVPRWAWWPEELMQSEGSPVVPETTADLSPVAEDDAVDPSPTTEETAASASPEDADTTADWSSVATDTTTDSSPAATDTVQNPALVTAATTACPSSTASDSTVDVSSVPVAATADPAPAATVTAASSAQVAAVVPASLTPVVAVTAVDVTPAAAVITVKRVRVAVESTTKAPLGPWHQWVLNLFAGRKPIQPKSNEPSDLPPPVSIISWTRERSDSDPLVPPPCVPRLEVPKLLPETRDKKMEVLYQTRHQLTIYPARANSHNGKAAKNEGAYTPAHIQRGFVVARHPHQVPLAQRRNNSHSTLLDRQGTNWAEWSKLNITAESMPFTRSQSDTQLLHPRTAEPMTRDTDKVNNGHLTKSQTGHSFLEDAGHRYPFGQGMGW